jgi:hypothetical protein
LVSRKVTSLSLDQAGKAVMGSCSRRMAADILFLTDVNEKFGLPRPALECCFEETVRGNGLRKSRPEVFVCYNNHVTGGLLDNVKQFELERLR